MGGATTGLSAAYWAIFLTHALSIAPVPFFSLAGAVSLLFKQSVNADALKKIIVDTSQKLAGDREYLTEEIQGVLGVCLLLCTFCFAHYTPVLSSYFLQKAKTQFEAQNYPLVSIYIDLATAIYEDDCYAYLPAYMAETVDNDYRLAKSHFIRGTSCDDVSVSVGSFIGLMRLNNVLNWGTSNPSTKAITVATAESYYLSAMKAADTPALRSTIQKHLGWSYLTGDDLERANLWLQKALIDDPTAACLLLRLDTSEDLRPVCKDSLEFFGSPEYVIWRNIYETH